MICRRKYNGKKIKRHARSCMELFLYDFSRAVEIFILFGFSAKIFFNEIFQFVVHF
jgi:hypothetical protein